jgi:hypothetical protein
LNLKIGGGMENRFSSELNLKFLGDNKFKLREDFKYVSPIYGAVIARKGYITDGASIPDIVFPIVGSPWEGKYPKIAVIHDWLCSTEGVTHNGALISKKDTDRIFLEGMKYLGVSWWRRNAMYRAVRLYCGKFSWEKKKSPKMGIISKLSPIKRTPQGTKLNWGIKFKKKI